MSAQYMIGLALLVVGIAVAIHFHIAAKKARDADEAKRKAFEREARLIERRKKPRDPR